MIIEEIEKKRKELIDIANCYGIDSIKTIECSEELDKLINYYQKGNAPSPKSASSYMSIHIEKALVS